MKKNIQTSDLLIYTVYEIKDRLLHGIFVIAGLTVLITGVQSNQNILLVIFFGSLFFLIGLLNMLSPIKIFTFDKTKNQFIFKQQSLLGIKIVDEFPLSEIQQIKFNVKQHLSHNQNSHGKIHSKTKTFQVNLIKINKQIPLTSDSSNNKTSKKEMASCIRHFLNNSD